LQALQVGLQDNIKTRQQAAQMHAKLLQLPENNRPTIDQLFAAGPCPHVTRWEDKQVWGTLLERFKNTIMPTDREVFERMLREGFEKITGLWLNPLGPASSGNSFTNKLKVSAMTWENNIIPELLKRYDEWRTKFLEGGK
jgi:hypothetical protein